MVTVQPFSSCVVVIVRPLASVADEVARALPRPLLRELDDTLTDELDETDDELDEDWPPALLAERLAELFAMLLVSRPSSPMRTTAQSAGMLMRSAEAGAPISRPAAAPRA